MLLPSAAIRARRAMAKHQHKAAPYSQYSFAWLLVLEIADLLRSVGFRRVLAVSFVTAATVLAVEVVFADSTPGPALTGIWRWLVAAAITVSVIAAWAVRRAVRETDREDELQPRDRPQE